MMKGVLAAMPVISAANLAARPALAGKAPQVAGRTVGVLVLLVAAVLLAALVSAALSPFLVSVLAGGAIALGAASLACARQGLSDAAAFRSTTMKGSAALLVLVPLLALDGAGERAVAITVCAALVLAVVALWSRIRDGRGTGQKIADLVAIATPYAFIMLGTVILADAYS